MRRVFVFAHYTPHDTAEMSVVSSEAAKIGSANPSVVSNADAGIYEIEVFKSQVVTVASCHYNDDKGNVENIRYKSCGDPAGLPSNAIRDNGELKKKDAATVGSVAEHKARRFKRISLQWLLKPSRKASHNSSRIRRVSGTGKHRIARINSAPKTFGPSAGGYDFSHSDAEKTVDRNSPKEGAQQGSRQTGFKRDTRKMRRISLPAPVLDVSESGVDKRLADISLSRTPEPSRRNVVEFDDKFIQSLRIRDHQLTSEKKTKQGTATGKSEAEHSQVATVNSQDIEGRSPSTRDSRETSAQLRNARRESAASSNANARVGSRPALKLHKFHNPDIFYMPLPDDGSQNSETLSHKLCRARLIEPRNENYLIQECVKEQLQTFLQDKQFCSESCQRWCLELSQNIKTSVHRMKVCESKIVCVVYIVALRGYGVHAAAQCIWTPSEDNFITVNFNNRTMIAVASVLAIKYA